MGPIEFTFVVVMLLFGVVGIVRGWSRELGITTMLALALFVLEFIAEGQAEQVSQMVEQVFRAEPGSFPAAQALLFCGFLIIIAFMSYQGETLTFSSKNKTASFGLITGLFNGYLFAGSLWYYLERADWPGIPITADYLPRHSTFFQFLPPSVFEWKHLIALAVILLIMRVWK